VCLPLTIFVRDLLIPATSHFIGPPPSPSRPCQLPWLLPETGRYSALDERAAVIDANPHRSPIGLVRDRDVAAEAPDPARSRQGVGVEPFAVGCPLAMVAVADAVLTGDAGFLRGHGDVDRDDAFEDVLSRGGHGEERAQRSARRKQADH